MNEGPILEVGGVTTGGLGHAAMYGRIRLFADRLEFDKRTQHMVIPISQISGVATEGVLRRKIKVYSKTGEAIVLESPYITKRHFDQLSWAIRRLSAEEDLAPWHFQREREEAVAEQAEVVADTAASAARGTVNAVKQAPKLWDRLISAFEKLYPPKEDQDDIGP
jgi:hypothetical protein